MKRVLSLLPLLSLVILLASCAKSGRKADWQLPEQANQNAVEHTQKKNPKFPGGKTLSGEIDLATTRAYIGGYDPATSKYTYLWNKTPTKTITLFVAQDPLAGTNKANITTTLTIEPTGKCFFSVTVPSWFDSNRDFVSGAIDMAAGATPGQWTVSAPSSIDDKGETYLPMFFPLTKAVGGLVKPTFQVAGSVLAIRVTNNTAANFTLDKLQLNSQTFSTSGTITWPSIFAGALPTWTGSNPGSTNTISVTNCVIAPTKTDTVYVWVKQQLTSLAPIYIIAKNATGTGPTIVRPAPAAILADNKFYGIAVNVTTPSIGNLPVGYYDVDNLNLTNWSSTTYIQDGGVYRNDNKSNTYYSPTYIANNLNSAQFNPAGWKIPSRDEAYILAPYWANAGGDPPLAFRNPTTSSGPTQTVRIPDNTSGITYTMNTYFSVKTDSAYGIYSFYNTTTGITYLYSRKYVFHRNGINNYTGGNWANAAGLEVRERFYALRTYDPINDLNMISNEDYWKMPAYEVIRFFPALGTLSSGSGGVYANIGILASLFTSTITSSSNKWQFRAWNGTGSYVWQNTSNTTWWNLRLIKTTVTIGQ